MTDLLSPASWQEHEGDVLPPETQFPTDYTQPHKNAHELRHEHPEFAAPPDAEATPVAETPVEPAEDGTAPYDHVMREGEWRLTDQTKTEGKDGLTQVREVEPEPIVPKEPTKDISEEAQATAARGLAASRINIRLAAQKAAKQLES